MSKHNEEEKGSESMCATSAAPANDSFMLARAEEHITKLTQELKNKTGELMAASEKAHYYRTMLMKILEL